MTLLCKVRGTYAFTVLGHFDSNAGGSRGFADATLATNEDPSQALLLDQVFESWSEFLSSVGAVSVDHCL